MLLIPLVLWAGIVIDCVYERTSMALRSCSVRETRLSLDDNMVFAEDVLPTADVRVSFVSSVVAWI